MTTTWNAFDQSSTGITVSGAGLVASSTGGDRQIRTTDSAPSGKVYAEFVVTTLASGSGFGIGIKNSTEAFGSFLGQGSGGDTSVCDFIHLTGWNGTSGSVSTAAQSNVVSIAVDVGAKLVWQRVNGGNWNASGTANPATGVGGAAYTGVAPICFAANLSNGDVITARFAASSWGYAAPAGFAEINAPAATTWNPSDKTAGVTLTNGNLTASGGTGGYADEIVRSVNACSGKIHLEYVITSNDASDNIGLGFANASQSLTSDFGGVNSIAYFVNSGNLYINGSFIASGPSTSTNGAVVAFEWDTVANLLWIAVGGGLWNNSATANPATGVGGISTAARTGAAYFAAVDVPTSSTANTVTARFDAGSWTRTPSSGFGQINASGGGGTNGAATGATTTATASALSGAATGGARANNSLLVATATIIAGAASTVNNGSAAGATIPAAATTLSGAASGSGSASGATVSAAASVLAGSAAGGGNATAIGATLPATASVLAGAATGVQNGGAPGAVLAVTTILFGGTGYIPNAAGNDRLSYDVLKVGRLIAR